MRKSYGFCPRSLKLIGPSIFSMISVERSSTQGRIRPGAIKAKVSLILIPLNVDSRPPLKQFQERDGSRRHQFSVNDPGK